MPNPTDHVIYNTRKLLDENKAKIDPAMFKQAEDVIRQLKDNLSKDDATDTIRRLTEELMQIPQQISAQLYQSSGQATQGRHGESSRPENSNAESDGDVVDAEFEEVKRRLNGSLSR